MIPLGRSRSDRATRAAFATSPTTSISRWAPKTVPYVLTQGYALTSLMTYYGDPAIAIVQPEQRIRWISGRRRPKPCSRAPGLALGEAGRRFDLILKMRYRSVEPAGLIERRRADDLLGTYELYRVADPFAPALDPECPSAEVDLQRKCRP